MREDLAAQRPLFADIALEQPSPKRIVFESRRGIDRLAHAAIGGPGTKALLQPDRQPGPTSSVAESFGRISRRHLEHRKGSDHWTMLCLVQIPVFGPSSISPSPNSCDSSEGKIA